MLWTLDDERADDLLVVKYPYFERNHGLGEIFTALLEAGLEITAFTEHDSVPWNALPGKMEQIGGGEWRLSDDPSRLPCSYTLQAIKA